MIKQIIEYLEGYDAEVGKAIRGEYNRQRRNLEISMLRGIRKKDIMVVVRKLTFQKQ